MKGMVIYFDDLRACNSLSDEQLGQLVRLLAYYGESGEPASCDDLAVMIAYGLLSQKVDMDREKYDRIVERNRENGRKGGRPSSKENPLGFLGTQTNPEKQNRNRNKNGNRNRNGDENREERETTAAPADDSFSRFWSAYPKKVAKAAARKAWDKLKPDEDLTATILSAIEAQKAGEQWRKNGGQFIPNPATWLNGERWNDEVRAQATYNPWLDALRGGQS